MPIESLSSFAISVAANIVSSLFARNCTEKDIREAFQEAIEKWCLLIGVLVWTVAVLCGASVRLVVQFVAMGLLILQLFLSSKGEGLLGDSNLLINVVFVIVALIVCVGATNIYNFMDGINGITAGYSIAVLLPLLLMNRDEGFMSDSFLVVSLISVLVFSFSTKSLQNSKI